MSSNVSVCIGYAHKSCTPELVMRTFEQALEDTEIVHRVDEIEKTNTNNGETFKVFFVHFAFTNTAVQHMLSRIEQDEYFIITYGTRLDRKTGANTDTYWKVTAFKPKPKNDDFKPRIMSVEEAEFAGIKAPKKA
jgi:hypothetical protein